MRAIVAYEVLLSNNPLLIPPESPPNLINYGAFNRLSRRNCARLWLNLKRFQQSLDQSHPHDAALMDVLDLELSRLSRLMGRNGGAM